MNALMSSEVFSIDMLEPILEGREKGYAKPARPCLLLHGVSPLICEVTASLCLKHSVRSVQVIDHYVPSLAGKRLGGMTLAGAATFCGIV